MSLRSFPIFFDIKDLGPLTYFLGLEVTRDDDAIFLSQRKYVLDLLSETGKLGAKAVRTPIEEHFKDQCEGELLQNPEQYRRVVGKLIYLTITRPDLSFAVHQVSQWMHAPTTTHWQMIDRILKYLKGTPNKGLWMRNNQHTKVIGYCDADWAGDRTDRKSTTGYCTFVGGNLVTWKSKKQTVVARSSAEAEYRAMANTTSELVWLKQLLEDLGFASTKPIPLHCDNQAALHIAANSVFHERTKHIEVDCHFIREKIANGIISTMYTRSQDQLADILTKATSSVALNKTLNKIGLTEYRRPILRGNVEEQGAISKHSDSSRRTQATEDSDSKGSFGENEDLVTNRRFEDLQARKDLDSIGGFGEIQSGRLGA
ncbi:PREDICTED: uncharacterized protein LOC109116021 [Tarenaya hassleriana]|uniref:uncharacterized protein LOC109116021 n=1 Tax=Tarenaya hassleriana TaxID=28532 RepID=UPI0008FD15F8|nr:PREDICTED: uncharacterized protein LOC109116021 [Tarenaya hassleriana]